MPETQGAPATPARPNGQPAQPATPQPASRPVKQPEAVYHVRYTLLTPAGYQIELSRDVKGSELIPWVKARDDNFTQAGFKPLPATGAAPAAGVRGDDDSWIPKFCPDCGSRWPDGFYDNRDDPSRPQGAPDVKCKGCAKGFWKDPPRGARRGNARR